MTPERYQQIGKLFNAALERPAAERSAWLQQASGSDAELRAEVEKLLANDVESDSFLARPAMGVAAELLVQKQPLTADLVGQQITHYQNFSLLGAGGMGQVYLAKDTRLGRQVALKLLPTRFLQSAEHLRRFEREALAASALNHPNILTIYEFGAEADAHFLATEFVQGETLRQRLTRGQLTVAEILAITGQIVAALQAAHEADGAGKTWSTAEQEAGASGFRYLTQEDPAPQTIYRVAVKPGAPLLVKVGLRYSQAASRKSKR